MATRSAIGRQYGTSALPEDLVPLESLNHEISEGQPDPRGYELWSGENEKLGTIRTLLGSPSTEKAYFALVATGGKEYLVPLESLSIDARERRVYSPYSRAQFTQAPTYQTSSRDFHGYWNYWHGADAAPARAVTGTERTAQATTEEMRVPITEEQAQVRKVQREVGHVGLRKRVEVETRHISEPVSRTRVEVERHAVPADQQQAAVANATPLNTGETIRVPVTKEELVVEKVPRVTEEVVLRKETETRQAEQDVQLRREHVEVEEEGDVEVDAAGTANRRRSP
jgi:uncharacterized protein (TIGR02271 family)